MSGAAGRTAQARRDRERQLSGPPDRSARGRGTDAKLARDDGPACAPTDGASPDGCSVHDATAAGSAGGRRDKHESKLRAVQDLDRNALAAQWRQIFDRDPPPRVSRELMVRAICHHVQVEVHGGLDRHTRRRLDQLVAEVQSGKAPTGRPFRIKPGTRLVREWHGEIHEVLVLEEGFAYRRRIHRSLSAIAREITGTSWNGHRFFGLRSPNKRVPSSLSSAQASQSAAEPADG